MIRILISLATTLLLQSSLSAQIDTSSHKQLATKSVYLQGGYFHDVDLTRAYGFNTLNIGYRKSRSSKTDIGLEIRYQAIDTEGIDRDIQFLGFDTTLMQFISDTFFVNRIKSHEELSGQFVLHKNYLRSNKMKFGMRYGAGYLRRKDISLATLSNVEITRIYNALGIDANMFGTYRINPKIQMYVDVNMLEYNYGLINTSIVMEQMDDSNHSHIRSELRLLSYIHVGISYDF